MKKHFIFCIVLFASIFISCEEGFEPLAEFREDYVMYGIINGDSTYQTVVISKSYSSENFDPYSNTTDPAIQNAIVTLNVDGKEYILRDTSTARDENSRYNTPEYFYYTKEYLPDNRDNIEIKAVLPNGKVLTSSTTIPYFSLFVWEDDDDMLPIDKLYGDVLFKWKFNSPAPNLVYLPKFYINYLQRINGSDIKKVKEIPLDLISTGGNLVEKFPGASAKKFILYDTTIVYNAIENIKGNLPASDFTIINGEVELTIMDENFGNYFSSIQTLADGFTIKIYETNFSNVEGGIGVFGSYITKEKEITITSEFISRFGYNFLPEN